MKLILTAGSRRADRAQWAAALASAVPSRLGNGVRRTTRLARLAHVMTADGRIQGEVDRLCQALDGYDSWPGNRRMLFHTLRWARERGWLGYGPDGGPGCRPTGTGGIDYVATIPGADGGEP